MCIVCGCVGEIQARVSVVESCVPMYIRIAVLHLTPMDYSPDSKLAHWHPGMKFKNMILHSTDPVELVTKE